VANIRLAETYGSRSNRFAVRIGSRCLLGRLGRIDYIVRDVEMLLKKSTLITRERMPVTKRSLCASGGNSM